MADTRGGRNCRKTAGQLDGWTDYAIVGTLDGRVGAIANARQADKLTSCQAVHQSKGPAVVLAMKHTEP
jgi:hypothetical protein